ncbi:MAG: acyl-CoA dehydrogenase [Nevskia sp.]|nr:acyl-CoA dehydrogenase [Nevskia sp.]
MTSSAADPGTAPRRLSDTLYSDMLLPPETIEIRNEARAFADRVLRPIAHELNCTPERADAFRFDVFKAIADAGLYEIPYGKDVGGRGLTYPTLGTLVVTEELAYYSPGIASAMYDAQAILVGGTLNSAGGTLRREFLPRIVRGEFVASFATSEPEASTDLSPAAIRTVATRAQGGWTLNGVKRWITNSPAAEFVVLLCRTGDQLSMMLANMRDPGVKVSAPDLKMGNHPQLTADITFTNVFVPDEHVVGAVGGGLRVALSSLMLGRMGIGAVGVGMGQRAMDVATDYIQHRKVYGRPIASFQHWQFRFAELATELETARSLYLKGAYVQDRGGDASILASMAKVKGSETAVDIARQAIQACGAYGFARHISGSNEKWPLEAIYRDAKIGEIYEGANEIQKWIVARQIFGRTITG